MAAWAWTPPTCWSCWPSPRNPAAAAKLTTAQVSAALKRAHRRHVAGKTVVIRAALRPQLTQRDRVTAASAAVVRALVAVIATVNQQIATSGPWPVRMPGRGPATGTGR